MRIVTTLLLMAALSTAAWAAPDDGSTRDQDGNPYKYGITIPTPVGGVAPRAGGPTTFSDQASFLAAAGSVITETFEDEPVTAVCDGGGGLPVIAMDDFMATSSPDAMKLLQEACFGNYNTTPGGLKYLGADTDLAEVSADVLFLFNQPITALGLYLVDLDTAVLEVGINGVAYPVGPNGDGGLSYFGIVDATPFTQATFRIVTESDSHHSFDDVAYRLAGPVSLDPQSWGRTKADYRR